MCACTLVVYCSTLADNDDNRCTSWDFGEVVEHGCIAFDSDEPVDVCDMDAVTSTYVVVDERNDAVLPGVSGIVLTDSGTCSSQSSFTDACPVNNSSGSVTNSPSCGNNSTSIPHSTNAIGCGMYSITITTLNANVHHNCSHSYKNVFHGDATTLSTTHIETELQSSTETIYSLHNDTAETATRVLGNAQPPTQPLDVFDSIALHDAAIDMAMAPNRHNDNTTIVDAMEMRQCP